MDIWQETNWFAIQAKPHQESLAGLRVARLDLEVFLPRVRREPLAGGDARLVARPLFPGYFFASFCPLISLEAVQHAHGVLRVVGTRRVPIPIERTAIDAIRERVREDGLIRLERRPLGRGAEVLIEQGPLAGWIGRVAHEWDDGRRVTILLDALWHSQVIVEKRYLSLVGEPPRP